MSKPMTLTYKLTLATVKVNLHTKYLARRSNGKGVREFTDGWTEGRTDATKYIIYLALQWINITTCIVSLEIYKTT